MKSGLLINYWVVKIAVCLLFLAVFVLNAAAQEADSETRKNEFGVWGGVSPDSSTIFSSGRTTDAHYGAIGFRYARRFNNGDKVNLKYTIDAIPAAILSDKTIRFVPLSGNAFRIDEIRRTYYGYGVAPLGLQINFRPRHKLQPFLGSSGGLLIFNSVLQDSFGKRFNFTADVGGGAEYRLKKGRAIKIGYKYFHISNGGRGFVNPGIDNNLFYAGYSFSR